MTLARAAWRSRGRDAAAFFAYSTSEEQEITMPRATELADRTTGHNVRIILDESVAAEIELSQEPLRWSVLIKPGANGRLAQNGSKAAPQRVMAPNTRRWPLTPSCSCIQTLPPHYVIPAEEPVKRFEGVDAELSVILERANVVSAFGDPT
jgi:hypothetical protein